MDTLGKRLAQGDHAAFAELYDACADRLHHYLMVILGSKEDAEDALQETFVRLAANCKRLAKVENLTAYTFAIARNEALRLAGRRKTADPYVQLPKDNVYLKKSKRIIPGQMSTSDAATMVLSRLDPELREIVELKFFAGLTFREIADITACPQGTVATRYRTALDKMRAILAKDWT